MIPLFIQHKYLLLLSPQLKLFDKARSGLYNFRCPYCGDSKTNPHKRRGYIYKKKDTLNYKCHNCGVSTSFQNFLKDHDDRLYREMLLESFGKPKQETKLEAADVATTAQSLLTAQHHILQHYQRITPNSGIQAEYLQGRAFTPAMMARFYSIPDADELIRRIYTVHKMIGKFKGTPAVGIPYFDGNALAYFQIRLLQGKIRYLTMEVDGGCKLFGLPDIDPSKRVSVLEGAFDSVFVHNAVANGGAADTGNLQRLKGLDVRFIYDSDYRYNPDIKKQVVNRIKEGYSVVLYGKDFQYKDLNEAVMAGMGVDELNDYLDAHTFSGMRAQLELSRLGK